MVPLPTSLHKCHFFYWWIRFPVLIKDLLLQNKNVLDTNIQHVTTSDTFTIKVIQVYAPTSNPEEAEVEWFHEDPQDLLELTPKKDVLFIIGDWNAEVGSQETPGVTGKFALGSMERSRAKANRRLQRECTGHSKHPLPIKQEKTLHMDITRWSTPKSDWLYSF